MWPDISLFLMTKLTVSVISSFHPLHATKEPQVATVKAVVARFALFLGATSCRERSAIKIQSISHQSKNNNKNCVATKLNDVLAMTCEIPTSALRVS
jgi:hypothetical protein